MTGATRRQHKTAPGDDDATLVPRREPRERLLPSTVDTIACHGCMHKSWDWLCELLGGVSLAFPLKYKVTSMKETTS